MEFKEARSDGDLADRLETDRPSFESKLAPELRARLGKPGRERIEVQIRLASLPPDGLRKLKALGFELAATLMPDRLLLGTLPADHLEALAKLDFVRRIEPPRFR